MPSTYHDLDWPNAINLRHPLNRGLLAWWLGVPDRAKGVYWVDLLRQRNATLTSMTPHTAWVAGRDGSRALKFVAASSQWASFGTGIRPTAFPVAISGTVILRSTALCLICGTGCKSGGTNYQGVYLSAMSGGTLQLLFGNNTASNSTGRNNKDSATILASNVRYHFTGAARGKDDMSLYIDGKDDGGTYSGTATSIAYGSAVGAIGSRDVGSASYADAEISDVRIVARNYTAAEAAQLYRESLAGYPTMLRRRRPVAKAPAAAASGAVRIVNGGPINHPIYGGLCAAVER